MDPIKTVNTNFVYRGPRSGIGDLPCYRRKVEGDGSTDEVDPTAVYAVFRPTDEERKRIAEGANIELGILYLEPIPPVSLEVTDQQELASQSDDG